MGRHRAVCGRGGAWASPFLALVNGRYRKNAPLREAQRAAASKPRRSQQQGWEARWLLRERRPAGRPAAALAQNY